MDSGLSWVEWVSAIGSVASLIGVLFAIYQIHQSTIQIKQNQIQIEKTATAVEASREATVKAMEKFNRELTIEEIATHLAMTESVLLFLKQESFHSAGLKLKEIRNYLIVVKEKTENLKDEEKTEIEGLILSTSKDIQNLISKNANPRIINENVILDHINTISIWLTTIKSRM